MAALQSDVSAYLEESARWPWIWGERDCALWVANFVRQQTGKDPGATWRGSYKTRLGCERVLKRGGGLVEVMALGAASVGLAPLLPEDAFPGCAGIILAPILRRNGLRMENTGALRTKSGWAAFSAHGIVVRQTKAVAAWRV